MEEGGRRMRSIFLITGSQKNGLGHLERSIVFAKELKKNIAEFATCFIFPDNDVVRQKVGKEGFEYKTYPKNITTSEQYTYLKKIINEIKPRLIVCDQGETSIQDMHVFTSSGALVISFDDLGEGGYASAILVDANREKLSAPQNAYHSPVEKYRQTFQSTQIQLFGEKYMVLSPKFLEYRKKRGIPKLRVRNILISLGGGDLNGSTVKVVLALKGQKNDVSLTVVIGAAFTQVEELEDALQGVKHTLHKNTQEMAKLMSEADIALVSGGVTLYEAASVGLPSLSICTAQHQVPIAMRLEKQGSSICLGLDTLLSEERIAKSVKEVMGDWQKRISMSQKAKALIDGRGLQRIIKSTIEELRKKST